MKKIFLLILCAMCLSWGVVYAQEDQDASADSQENGEEVEIQVIAEVNITDAYIMEQNGHNFAIDFTLENGNGAQSDVRYGVQLLEKNADGTDQYIAYQKVFDEKVNLQEHTAVSKSISFDVPTYLSGTYDVVLVAQNGEGLSLGYNMVYQVELIGNTPYIHIDENTCYFFVKGLDDSYDLMQGVDVASSEELVLSCEAESFLSESTPAQIQITTYERSLFGDRIDTVNVQQDITFESGEKKRFDIVIAQPQKPQAYDVAVVLMNEEGQTISPTVYGHYVVQGVSASIANVQVDKNQYAQGEKIAVSFLWTASADAFPGARSSGSSTGQLYYDLTLVNESDKTCFAQIKRKPLDMQSNGYVRIEQTATRDCAYPEIAVQIVDENGTVLAVQKFDFAKEAKQDLVQAEIPVQQNFTKITAYVIGFITLIAFLVIGGYMLKNKGVKMLFLFLLGGMSIMGMPAAQAETVTATIGSSYATCNFGLSKTTLDPGESFSGSSSGCKIVACWNEMNMAGYINGVQVSSRSVSDGSGGGKTYTYDATNGSTTITAGTECKEYKVPVQVDFNHKTSAGWQSATAKSSLSYDVEGCIDFNAKLSTKVEGCAGGDQKGTANVIMTVGDVTGNATGAIEYRYKCSTAAWTGWTSKNTYTCPYTTAGAKTVSAQARRQGITTSVKSATVTIVACPTNGACNSNVTGDYAWTDTNFREATLCANGTTPVPKTVKFPGYGQTVTWGCNGLNGGTNTDAKACSATRGTPPPCACTSWVVRTDYPYTATSPATPLCATGASSPATVSFPSGKYGTESTVTWTCKSTTAKICSGAAANCSAQRLLPPPCACNSATTRTDYAYTKTAPDTPLCAVGAPSPATVSFPSGKYGADSTVNWTCGNTIKNPCSANTATCSAQRVAPPACACGPTNGIYSPTKPSANLCAVGTASAVTGSGNDWTWTCGTKNGTGICLNQAKCSAVRFKCTGDLPPFGATWCPDDTEALTASIAWTQATNNTCTNTRKCEYVLPVYSCLSPLPPYGADWCENDTIGLTASIAWAQAANNTCTNTRKCEYIRPISNGDCGSADGGSSYDQPMSNLCDVGTVAWQDQTAGDGTWDWQCNGANGGTNAVCSKTKNVVTPPTTTVNTEDDEDGDGRMIETRP